MHLFENYAFSLLLFHEVHNKNHHLNLHALQLQLQLYLINNNELRKLNFERHQNFRDLNFVDHQQLLQVLSINSVNN